MKILRYRKPSLKTALGVTKAKKRIKKELGITAFLRPFRAPRNFKRRIKRRFGYYSTAGKLIRKRKPPTPFGF